MSCNGRPAVTADKAEKVRLYHRIAALWTDKLAKQQNAVGALEKILEIDPGEETARRRLREIYTRGRSWRPLLDLMRRELRLLPRAQHAAQLAAMAEIAADRLGSAREAIGLQNEVLEILPRDAVALASLAKLYEKEGRWAALAEILGRQAVVAGEDTPTGCELLERRGIVLHGEAGRHRRGRGHPAQGARRRAGQPPGAAGPARDPRPHRQLRGPRGAVRQPGLLGGALRGALGGGRAGHRRPPPRSSC